MKAKPHRLMATIGIGALMALPAAATAADGDGPEKRAQASVALQQPAPAAKAPATQSVSDEERLRWMPGPDQLNVPGNAAFGRVASK